MEWAFLYIDYFFYRVDETKCRSKKGRDEVSKGHQRKREPK